MTDFSCNKRAKEPNNEFAACLQHCGNEGTCPSNAENKDRRYQVLMQISGGEVAYWSDVDKQAYELSKHAGGSCRIVDIVTE